MKVKYVWHDQPNVEKVFDTVHAFAIMPRIFKRDQTQEEYDAFELQNFASKKEQGLVLSYEVIEGGATDGEIPEPRGNA